MREDRSLWRPKQTVLREKTVPFGVLSKLCYAREDRSLWRPKQTVLREKTVPFGVLSTMTSLSYPNFSTTLPLQAVKDVGPD